MWNPVQRSRSITVGAAFAVAIACPTGLESALGSAASAATTRTGAAAGDGGVSSFYRFRGRLPQKPGLLLRERAGQGERLSSGGLFSAYCLDEGIVDSKGWPAQAASSQRKVNDAARSAIAALLQDFSARGRPSEADTETQLVEKIA